MNAKIMAALLAVGIASSASAVNNIYITGSTAFRGSAYTSLVNDTNHTGVFDVVSGEPTVCGYGNSTQSKSQYALAHGHIGGVETYISMFWSGSEAGIACVSGNPTTTLNDGDVLTGVSATFLKCDATANPPNSGTASLPTSGNLETSPRQADLAFSDTSQAVSLTKVSAYPCTSYGIVGIVPFVWYKGAVNKADSAWSRLTNIQAYQANEILLTGSKTADFFNSGVAGGYNDYDHTVYLIGRNKGSGTRVNELIAAGYPIGQGVVQYQANSTIGVNPFNNLYGLYFDVTVSGYHLAAMSAAGSSSAGSDNGYEGGGDVKNALDGKSANSTTTPATQNSVPATTGYSIDSGATSALTIGFLSVGDAGLPASGTPSTSVLTYNGVTESDGAIENGTYICWGHEHLYGQVTPSNPAATALVPVLKKAIKKQLCNNDNTSATGYDASVYYGSGANVLADPATLHSPGIYGFYMYADRGTTQADTGYPVSGNAVGNYTWYNGGTATSN